MRIALLSVLFLLHANLAQALSNAETIPSTSASTPVLKVSAAPQYRNFLGSGLRIQSQSTGPTIFYSRRIGTQFLVGSSFFYGIYEQQLLDGGHSASGQYYRDDVAVNTSMLELNGTYFFKTDGYARSGFLARAAVGRSHLDLKVRSRRYDDDPGWLHFGDGKREIESLESRSNSNSTYSRLGGYYQFVWNRTPQTRGAHILELGLSATQFDREQSASVVKNNGTRVSRSTDRTTANLEVSYTRAF